MNNTPKALFKSIRQVKLVSATPNRSTLTQDKISRKRAMAALSFALMAAVGCIALVIGSSVVEASSLPAFTVSSALAAKQDAGIAGVATISLTLIAFAALALVFKKQKS